MMQAIDVYRARFRASEYLDRPYVMLGFNVYAADTDEEARYLATSRSQAFIALRSGRPGPLPPPVADFESRLSEPERALLAHSLSCSAIGSPETVRATLEAFISHTRADELMITTQMFEQAARLRSYEITAKVWAQMN
jgi:alkanesulfonate monooxygenase SsuD/methylene tetrahydromethanopterin reductase-like flavin-dependent oxidoreductase (luciferase family)